MTSKKGITQAATILLLSVLAIFSSAALAADAADVTGNVQRNMLKQANLEKSWFSDLPIRTGEEISTMLVHKDFLCVLTDGNYLFFMDRKTGELKYSLLLAEPDIPLQGPGIYKNELYFVAADRVMGVDPYEKDIVFEEDFDFIEVAVGAPARNSEYLYIPSSTRKVIAIDLEKLIFDWQEPAADGTIVNSVLADEEMVIAGSVGGGVMQLPPDRAQKRWRFKSTGLKAPVIRDGGFVYVSSVDTKLYKLDVDTGASPWLTPFQAGQPLETSVKIGRTTIYQYAGKNGLYSVDKKDGSVVWNVETGRTILAENAQFAYVWAQPSRLVTVDIYTGKRVYTVNLAGISDVAYNTIDSLIYVAYPNGRVVCLSPTD